MITVGIDVGFENIKIVVLNDGKVLARSMGRSGSARAEATERIWQETLKSLGISASDVDKVAATGQGMHDVGFAAERITEPTADSKAVRFLYPEATSVIDIGADQIWVVTLIEDDKISEMVLNQKCAAGLGIFLKYMARRLEMTLETMSNLSQSKSNMTVNSGCCVFMELDALNLLFDGVASEEVAQIVVEAIGVKINSVLNDKIKPAQKTTVLVGGVSKNTAVVNALKARSGIDFIIPENAEYIGALGAALVAAE